LIIFAAIGLLMYFYGGKCFEKIQQYRGLNLAITKGGSIDVEERENMIRRA